jgi:hypothetical protein
MSESQQTVSQRKARRPGLEQLRDAINDAEQTVVRLSETNNRILKNKLELISQMVGKHCGVQAVNLTRKGKVVAPRLSTIVEESSQLENSAALATSQPPVPTSQVVSKMESKARVIDQTFNKFRTEVSSSLKTAGKPLTTEGNKVVSSVWKDAKEGKIGSVKNSLRSLGVAPAEVSPMAAKAIEEARAYLSRAETRKVKATPVVSAVVATPGKTRKVSMAKKGKGAQSLAVPPLSQVEAVKSIEALTPSAATLASMRQSNQANSAETTADSPSQSSPKTVTFDGNEYYVLGRNQVFEKKEDDSVGDNIGTWDEVQQKVVFSS